MIQVGGIPFAWQDPVETDCVKYADDDYLSYPTERATHFARADSWQLVLQFDDGFVGEYNWDFRFYVCNRRSDLAEGRFDRCSTVMQCT
jgi:hypothetical protein